MYKILCFGETLLRMSPPKNWEEGSIFNSYVGGAESNVALALRNWNIPVKYITAFPDNFLSEKIINYYKNKNVDTSAILKYGKRMGIYYLQQGSDLKNESVIYDRTGSSFAELKPGKIDWDEVLEDVSHIHTSAISAAVLQSVSDVCIELFEAAKRKNIFISLDLNYREKLWQYGKRPLEIMSRLAQYSNLIMGNLWSANKMLGIELNKNLHIFFTQNEFINESQKASNQIMEEFPACELVANTFRFNIDNKTVKYFATVCNREEFVFSKEKIYTEIIDKAGTGDCFMAGLIYGLLQRKTLRQTIDFATTAAVGKFYEKGDHTNQTIEVIDQKILNNE